MLSSSLAGLDTSTRTLVLTLLESLHNKNQPHIILGMRPQDPIPDWTTHLALIRKDGKVHTGAKDEVLGAVTGTDLHPGWRPASSGHAKSSHEGEPLVNITGVNVTYGDRKVRRNIAESEMMLYFLPGVKRYPLDNLRELKMAPDWYQRGGKDHAPCYANWRAPTILHSIVQALAFLETTF